MTRKLHDFENHADQLRRQLKDIAKVRSIKFHYKQLERDSSLNSRADSYVITYLTDGEPHCFSDNNNSIYFMRQKFWIYLCSKWKHSQITLQLLTLKINNAVGWKQRLDFYKFANQRAPVCKVLLCSST